MNLSANPEGKCELQCSIQLLRNVPFFAELPPELIRVLAYLCERQVFMAGQEILAEGESADMAVIVVRGAARVCRGAHHVAAVEPGSCVGGLALLGQFRWLYALRATTEVECLVLPRHKFLPQFQAQPAALVALARGLVAGVVACEQGRLEKPGESPSLLAML